MIFTLTSNVLTVFIKGKPYSVDSSHVNFDNLVAIAKGQQPQPSDEALVELLSVRESIQAQITDSRVRLGTDEIIIDGLPVHSYSTTRILQMMREGVDITPWIKFLERCIENPAAHVFNELFQWMEKGNMPVTPEGHFLAYKKVDDNFRSYHPSPDGTHLLHEFGEYLAMPRYQVDDDRNRTCSTGLHFCSWDYLNRYYGSQGRVIVLDIDPADVVSIPTDYNHTKGRACGYVPLYALDPKDVEHAFHDGSHPFEGVQVWTSNPNLVELPDGAQVRAIEDGPDISEGTVYTVYNGEIYDDAGYWWTPDYVDFEVVSIEPKFQTVYDIPGIRAGDRVMCVAVTDSWIDNNGYQPGGVYEVREDLRIRGQDGHPWAGSEGAWVTL